MRTAAASVIIVLLWTWSAWAITDGFDALTSEQARRLNIARAQQTVPQVRLIDQAGHAFRFDEWVLEKNKLLIVDFIYTNCQSICRALGTEFQQLQRSITERGLQNRVHLMSVSFDPHRDSYAMLRKYAGQHQAKPEVWTHATVVNAKDLDVLLRTFGVTVIPDRQGGFQHNAALVWVTPSGKLMRVTDYDSNDNFRILDELAKAN